MLWKSKGLWLRHPCPSSHRDPQPGIPCIFGYQLRLKVTPCQDTKLIYDGSLSQFQKSAVTTRYTPKKSISSFRIHLYMLQMCNLNDTRSHNLHFKLKHRSHHSSQLFSKIIGIKQHLKLVHRSFQSTVLREIEMSGLWMSNSLKCFSCKSIGFSPIEPIAEEKLSVFI